LEADFAVIVRGNFDPQCKGGAVRYRAVLLGQLEIVGRAHRVEAAGADRDFELAQRIAFRIDQDEKNVIRCGTGDLRFICDLQILELASRVWRRLDEGAKTRAMHLQPTRMQRGYTQLQPNPL
jgi:hypothetical protein